jgi:hypothetical protein
MSETTFLSQSKTSTPPKRTELHELSCSELYLSESATQKTTTTQKSMCAVFDNELVTVYLLGRSL